MSFQTELILNTHVTVSDMRHDVSRMRSDMSEIREEISGQFHSVSASCTHPSAQGWYLRPPSQNLGQQLRLPGNPVSYIRI